MIFNTLDNIPFHSLLAELFPGALEVKDAVKKNRSMWVRMHEKIQREKLEPKNSMEVFEMDILGESTSWSWTLCFDQRISNSSTQASPFVSASYSVALSTASK